MLRRPAGVPRLDLRPAFCARDRLGAMVAAERRAASPVGPRLRRHRFSFGEIITTPRSKPRESPAGGRNDNTVSLAEDAFRRYHYDPMRKVPLADDPMYINPAGPAPAVVLSPPGAAPSVDQLDRDDNMRGDPLDLRSKGVGPALPPHRDLSHNNFPEIEQHSSTRNTGGATPQNPPLANEPSKKGVPSGVSPIVFDAISIASPIRRR